jgi:hypothetical protein
MGEISRVDTRARLGSLPDAIEADNGGCPEVAEVRQPTGGRPAAAPWIEIAGELNLSDPYLSLASVRHAASECGRNQPGAELVATGRFRAVYSDPTHTGKLAPSQIREIPAIRA